MSCNYMKACRLGSKPDSIFTENELRLQTKLVFYIVETCPDCILIGSIVDFCPFCFVINKLALGKHAYMMGNCGGSQIQMGGKLISKSRSILCV